MVRVGPWISLPFDGESGKALLIRIEGTNGSATSLSGLVQLPPKDGWDTKLSSEEMDESDIPEHDEEGRSVLIPTLDARSSHCELGSGPNGDAWIWAGGVLGDRNIPYDR
jgi:hypothetical protein